jgi:hypothetical protein
MGNTYSKFLPSVSTPFTLTAKTVVNSSGIATINAIRSTNGLFSGILGTLMNISHEYSGSRILYIRGINWDHTPSTDYRTISLDAGDTNVWVKIEYKVFTE